jgi:hypothetical protein
MSVTLSTTYTQRQHWWSTMKVLATGKIMSMQYEDEGAHYTIWGYDGPEVHMCTIWKGTVPEGLSTSFGGADPVYPQATNDADLADFEANYKANLNKALVKKNQIGIPVHAKAAYAYVEQKTRFNGFRYIAEPDTITIFDEQITTQVYVQGGRATMDNVVDGDMVEFSIVDVDNVLGLFGMFGLTPGVDVLELDKYVRTVYPRTPGDEIENRVESAAAVVAGLYFRITYHAVAGGTDRIIKPVYLWYEA